ncbi:hypothetical protein [Streptomyces sp. NPDC046909]|uniref:hypothetical protein n=1 Tax=Streptomyces sp. NPDC046909 TaxID=3155617 RepID=UPI0033FEF1CF
MHQRDFALQGGADAVSATLWPLSVDGLLLLATVGLLNTSRGVGRRAHRRLPRREHCCSACGGVEADVGGGLATGRSAAGRGTARTPSRPPRIGRGRSRSVVAIWAKGTSPWLAAGPRRNRRCRARGRLRGPRRDCVRPATGEGEGPGVGRGWWARGAGAAAGWPVSVDWGDGGGGDVGALPAAVPPDGRPMVRSWTGWQGRTTTVGRCWPAGVGRAGSRALWIGWT